MTVWQSQEFDDHEHISYFTDRETGLRVIVAVHSTTLGPAAGGTRFKAYECDSDALDDALRLSRAMSYKSALAGLPIGGGKAVIIGDPDKIKSKDLLHAYGRFLNIIGGQFATGEDVGMATADIVTMNEVTPYVGGIAASGAGDPSLHTAVGVMHGLLAVLECRFSQTDFSGMRVAVQGLGAVGWGVAKRLRDAGAELVVSDVRADVVEKAVRILGAVEAPLDRIHAADVDIYVPCALGGVVTKQSAREIRAAAVAGAANNQLETPEAGKILWEQGILFAPDYLLNAGGIISALEETIRIRGGSDSDCEPLADRLANIPARLKSIFQSSQEKGIAPELVAEQMARDLIGR